MVKTVFTEGGLIIPRRLGWATLVALVVGAVAQVASYVEAKTVTAADIAALQRNDVESRTRGDDIRRRLTELEIMRVTVARMEERQRAQDEILREIRDTLRRR